MGRVIRGASPGGEGYGGLPSVRWGAGPGAYLLIMSTTWPSKFAGLGQEYKGVTNIGRADVAQAGGWVELDLDGEPAEVERALEYCRSRGIGVQRLEPA